MFARKIPFRSEWLAESSCLMMGVCTTKLREAVFCNGASYFRSLCMSRPCWTVSLAFQWVAWQLPVQGRIRWATDIYPAILTTMPCQGLISSKLTKGLSMLKLTKVFFCEWFKLWLSLGKFKNAVKSLHKSAQLSFSGVLDTACFARFFLICNVIRIIVMCEENFQQNFWLVLPEKQYKCNSCGSELSYYTVMVLTQWSFLPQAFQVPVMTTHKLSSSSSSARTAKHLLTL